MKGVWSRDEGIISCWLVLSTLPCTSTYCNRPSSPKLVQLSSARQFPTKAWPAWQPRLRHRRTIGDNTPDATLNALCEQSGQPSLDLQLSEVTPPVPDSGPSADYQKLASKLPSGIYAESNQCCFVGLIWDRGLDWKGDHLSTRDTENGITWCRLLHYTACMAGHAQATFNL